MRGFPAAKPYSLHIACFDKLGLHWFANAKPTVSVIANAVGAAPENVAAIVFAPNVGKPGDAYDMLKIQESEDELDAMLREDTYTTFEPPAASYHFQKNRLDVANLRGQVEPLFGLWFPRSGMQKASSFQNGMVASSRRESVHKDFLKRYHYLNKAPLHRPIPNPGQAPLLLLLLLLQQALARQGWPKQGKRTEDQRPKTKTENRRT